MACRSLCHAARPPALDTTYQPSSTAVTHAYRKLTLLLSRWKNLVSKQRGELNRLFRLNRRVFKAYLLKESLERLWDYHYEGAMLSYLQKWMD